MLLLKAIFRPGQQGQLPEKAMGIRSRTFIFWLSVESNIVSLFTETENELNPPQAEGQQKGTSRKAKHIQSGGVKKLNYKDIILTSCSVLIQCG